ncbi:hypothetical protein FKP32DRAFT_1587310 [Trametes sanguinea]|nr:hypothetical protein FKP32DRAFT_1587310 [Trametes sanguinea]
MAARVTRGGRVFSPYEVVEVDFATALRVADAFSAPNQGLDAWDLDPLSPLSSRSPSPSPSITPAATHAHDLSSNSSATSDCHTPRVRRVNPVSSLAVQPSARSAPPRLASTEDVSAAPAGSTSFQAASLSNVGNPGNHARRGKRARRTAKRAAAKQDVLSRKVKSSSSKHVARAAPLPAPLALRELRIAKGGFVGIRQRALSTKKWTMEGLLEKGFKCHDWDGQTSELLVDSNGAVVGMLAGKPQDPTWGETVAQVNEAMSAASAACRFSAVQKSHRRGDFATLAQGFSFGGGQTAPGNIRNKPVNARALAELCQHPAMLRIAGFGNDMLATYAPRVYQNMKAKLGALMRRYPSLRRPFANSLYPAASFNFGPETVCLEHTDAQNDPCNWCHITALGDYNPDQGGHLVLFDLGLIVRFPPGSSILIPSAIMRHGNIDIREGEKRMSFTQYCAGGLMRWVECGFRTVEDFAAQDPEGSRVFEESLEARVEKCVRLFSTLESLPHDLQETM